MKVRLGSIAAAFAVLAASQAAAATWDPRAWAGEDTLELRTEAEGEQPYWFPVWLVVLDDAVYVRLGSRAAQRVENNVTKPVLAVRVAGQEFPSVVGVPAPDRAEQVAAAMADKYWSDLVIRLLPHPLTLRLEPDGAAAASAGGGG